MCFYFNGNNISYMNNLLKYLILSGILISIGVSYYFYRTRTYVTAEFKNLRPFHDRAPIYYNGFKIGKVVRVRPNKTYTATIVTLRLHPMDLRLPVNITANLKREKNKKNDKCTDKENETTKCWCSIFLFMRFNIVQNCLPCPCFFCKFYHKWSKANANNKGKQKGNE